jgi:predicted nucleotide-binding protein
MMSSVKVPRHRKTGEWIEEEGWYVYRERTTRPFGQIKPEATRMLFRGSAALATTHEWNGETLHVRTIGMEGLVSLEDGYLTTRMRFDFWSPANFFPLIKSKVLSEVGAATWEAAGANAFATKDVFIIHGHDDGAREQLRDWLEKLGLCPIVLTEKSDAGLTVIEKLEHYATTCAFAIAIVTPDPNITCHDTAGEIARARPNVLLEIGWFMARLGRARVVLLSHLKMPEIGSDLDGLLALYYDRNVFEVAPQLSLRLREAGLL